MKFKSLRLAYVLGTQFPTPRAYGVTTRETLEVLLDYSIEFRIFCLKSSYSDKDFEKFNNYVIHMRILFISKVFRFISNYGNSKLNYLVWRLSIFFDLCYNITKIRRYKPNVIWTRDPLIAYVILRLFPKVKVILEVHESVGKIFYKKLIKFTRIKFFPINEKNNFFLRELFRTNERYQIMPMGIRNQIKSSTENIDDYVESLNHPIKEVFTIGYVGAFEPGGYSKGIEDLISLALYLQKNSLPYEVQLLGASISELKKYNSIKNELNLSDRYLKILQHVSHSEALASMKQFEILILPAYKSENYMGMPIKLLEYLNSGKITFIGDCELYRNFLPLYLHPLIYPSNDSEKLFSFIQSSLKSGKLNELLELSIDFSLNFSWEKRTIKILEAIEA